MAEVKFPPRKPGCSRVFKLGDGGAPLGGGTKPGFSQREGFNSPDWEGAMNPWSEPLRRHILGE